MWVSIRSLVISRKVKAMGINNRLIASGHIIIKKPNSYIWTVLIKIYVKKGKKVLLSKFQICQAPLKQQGGAGKPYWRGMLSTVNLLIEVACFVKKLNNMVNIKTSWYKLVSAMRSTVQSHSHSVRVFWVEKSKTKHIVKEEFRFRFQLGWFSIINNLIII